MKYILLLFLYSLLIGCNRGELIDIRDRMEENAESGKWIDSMRIQLVIDFENMQALYQAMEQKLYVTGIDKKNDGSYVLFYSDGSMIKLQQGRTPMISFGNDGEVIINGQGTGCKATDGTDGRLPRITLNEDGFYLVDGIPTDVKGTPGNPGNSPVVSIDADGYYCIDGARIINLKPVDGTDGRTPVPTIVKNETEKKQELRIDGQPTIPPTFLSPVDGTDAADGRNSDSFIKQIILSPDDELIFIFNDGSQQKSSPLLLSDILFELDTDNVEEVPLDGAGTFTYKLTTREGTGPVTVQLYKPVKGWEIEFSAPDPLKNEGTITVRPAAGGLTPATVLFLAAVDARGSAVVRRVKLSPKAYKLIVPVFNKSAVYSFSTTSGLKIAEACEEYNKEAGRILRVIYPCDPVTSTYGEGFVVDNGGTVNHRGLFYVPGSRPPAAFLQLYAAFVTEGRTGLPEAKMAEEMITDIDGNNYKMIKIADHYWMAENLRTEHYNNGARILNVASGAEWDNADGACCYYENNGAVYKMIYGALYSHRAVAAGSLAPAGWHIPIRAEWAALVDYTGASEAGLKLKAAPVGNNTGAGDWKESLPAVRGNNLSGYRALPGGTFDGTVFSGLGEYFYVAIAPGGDILPTGVISYDRAGFDYDDNFTGGRYVRCVKNKKTDED